MSTEAPSHLPHRDYYDYEVIAEGENFLSYYDEKTNLVITYETTKQ